jgi:hypothetical protein
MTRNEQTISAAAGLHASREILRAINLLLLICP